MNKGNAVKSKSKNQPKKKEEIMPTKKELYPKYLVMAIPIFLALIFGIYYY
jgi:hypothetical protein